MNHQELTAKVLNSKTFGKLIAVLMCGDKPFVVGAMLGVNAHVLSHMNANTSPAGFAHNLVAALVGNKTYATLYLVLHNAFKWERNGSELPLFAELYTGCEVEWTENYFDFLIHAEAGTQ